MKLHLKATAPTHFLSCPPKTHKHSFLLPDLLVIVNFLQPEQTKQQVT